MVESGEEEQEPPLSLNMLIASPLPLYFLREFLGALKKQQYQGSCPTLQCEAGWEMVMRFGFTPTALRKVGIEFMYRLIDALHGQ